MLPTPPHCAASWAPGRITAARWRNRASWSSTQWKVAVESTASTAFLNGSGRCRSATTKVIRSPPSRSRARPIIDTEPSSAITSPRGRRSSNAAVTFPVPHPASRTRSSPRRSSACDHTLAPGGHGGREPVVGGGVPVPRHAFSGAGLLLVALGGLEVEDLDVGARRNLGDDDVEIGFIHLGHDDSITPGDDALVAHAPCTSRARRRSPGTRGSPPSCRARARRGSWLRAYSRARPVPGRSGGLRRDDS